MSETGQMSHDGAETAQNGMVCKHTHGPWTIENGEGTIIRDSDGGAICQLNFLRGRYGLKGRRSDEEVQANARLIAAAPDLLAAAMKLEAAEEFYHNQCEECEGEGEPEACPACFPLFNDARVMRRLAIAKATGA